MTIKMEAVDSLSCNKQLKKIFFLKAAQMPFSVSSVIFTNIQY